MIRPDAFRLPFRTLAAVATGEVQAPDLALLESAQRSRLLLALSAIVGHARQSCEPRPTGGVPPTRPAAAWSLLATVQRADPEAFTAVLDDPAVGAWAFHLLRRLAHGAVATPSDAPSWVETSLLSSLAAAAAIRAGVRCSLRVPARRGQVWLPSLGLTGTVGLGEWTIAGVETGPRGTIVFGDSGSVRLPGDLSRRAEGWSPLPRIRVGEPGGSAGLVLDHLSPYRDFRSVRDPADLSGETLRRWRVMIEEALGLLHRDHPSAFRMVAGAVTVIMPMEGPSTLRWTSASVPDAYRSVAVSLPADATALAATLIHEARHQLLTAVDSMTPLCVPVLDGPEPTYFAPWRDDPRPVRGLLFGAHAFVGVASFWRERRSIDGERADFEFALHRWQLRTALAALRRATGLTEAGGRVVESLAELSRVWWGDPVRGRAGRLAALCYQDQRATWRAAHLDVDGVAADELASRWLSGLPPPSRLPAARAAAPRPTPRGGARTWLARLYVTDHGAFERARSDLDAGAVNPLGIVGATAADAALVAGDVRGARERYRRADPGFASSIGLGLAGDERAAMLVDRPELVLALRAALARRGVRRPGPEELAEWLGSCPAARDRSDAQ